MAFTIVSGVIETNNYITVTFSEGVYATAGGTGALYYNDIVVAIADDTGADTLYMAAASLKRPDGTTLLAGDSVVRITLNFTSKMPEGDGNITVHPTGNATIFNLAGEGMLSSETTGPIDLIPSLNMYVSKDGNDTNNGLTPANSKLTLANLELSLQPGYNKVHIGIGEYISTVDWNVLYSQIELYGDYDGSVFSSAAGEIIQKTSNDLYIDSVTRADRMTFWVYTSGEYFFKGTRVRDQVLNYCVLKCYSNGCYFITNSAMRTITLNNCTQTTGRITVGNTVMTKTKIIFNNWDNITGNAPFVFQYNAPPYIIFDNSSILYDTDMIDACSYNWTIKNSTLKMYDSSAILINGSFYHAANDIRSRSSILIKDCDILDNTGADVNINTNKYINYPISIFDVDASSSNYNIWAMHSSCYKLPILLDNINSDGKKNLLIPCGLTLTEEASQHNSKDVLFFNSNTNTTYLAPGIIKLNGLLPSQEYTVKFDFKKSINSVAATEDMRFGILKGSQYIANDLFDAPANAIDYIDVVAADHTYDTWYDDKTLTFTTDTDADGTDEVEYFLAFYTNGPINQYKLTQPEVAAIA